MLWLDIGKKEVSVPIYKNPSSSELSEIFKSGLVGGAVRYIATAYQKAVYVWNADLALHNNAFQKLKELKLIKSGLDCRELNYGVAQLHGGQLFFKEDGDWTPIIDALKKGKTIPTYSIPTPFKTVQDIFAALPEFNKTFKFIDEYIVDFSENGPFAQLQNDKKNNEYHTII